MTVLPSHRRPFSRLRLSPTNLAILYACASFCSIGLAQAKPVAAAPVPVKPLTLTVNFRYAEENLKLAAPSPGHPRVVLMGDSITFGWKPANPALFGDGHYLDRGIGGETTPQMLLRYRADVVDLHPAAVVILAGTNDLAQNTGDESIAFILGNIQSMVEIARAHGIAVVLCSITPADHFGWHPGIAPRADIRTINIWIEKFAAANHLGYVDYFSALASPDGTMTRELSTDGVHPTPAAYAIMQPLMEDAVKRALAANKPVS